MRYFLIIVHVFFCLTLFAKSNQSYAELDYKLFEEEGLQGLKDSNGEVLIPAKYESLGWSNGTFKVLNNVIGYKQENGWGLLSLENEKITAASYSRLFPENGSYLIASKKNQPGYNQLGLINTKGDEVLPHIFSSITVKGLRAVVGKKNTKRYEYGILNLKGVEILPVKYEFIVPIGTSRFLVKPFEEKARLYNENGNLASDIAIDSISDFKNDLAVIYSDYKRGLIRTNGQLVFLPNYQTIKRNEDGVIAMPFNMWVQLTAKNEKLNEFETEFLKQFTKESYLASTNGHKWLMNSTDGSKITPIYSSIVRGEKMAAIKSLDKWGVMRVSGEVKLSPRFDSVVVSNGLVFTEQKGSWALYDTFGIKKTEHNFQQIGHKTGRYFPVKRNNHWGFIDRYGELVIYCVYDDVGEFKDNLVAVTFHNKKGIIDAQGEWVVLPHDADSLAILNSNYFISYKEGLKRLKDFEGNLIYFTENEIELKESYLLEHTSDGGIWKIDFSGQIVEEARDEKYQEVRSPSEGFYAIKKDGAYGFIDAQNRLRIANRYDDVGDFHNGLAAFKLLGKWGFLNKKEEIVIQPNYKKVSHFYGNVAIAYDEQGAGLINIEGQKISSFNFDSLKIQENGRFLAYKRNHVGLLDATGRLMVNAKYDKLIDLNNGYVIVSNSEKYGLVDTNGVNTIPMQYNDLFYDEANDVYLVMKKSEPEKVTIQ